MEKKVGLITYHAAYNFGSVLQAYATQRVIESFGFSIEMIDYRTFSQTFWYHNPIRMLKGWKGSIQIPLFMASRNKRKIRARKFEDFISSYMNLTDKKFVKYEDFSDVSYDIMVSGSDQIWNINCGEFLFESKNSIRPYFLDFGNPNKRIAYASSFGSPDIAQVRDYIPFLKSYSSLSTREPLTKRYIEEFLHKDVELVCDPTWLLNKDEWNELITDEKPVKPYLIFYNLLFNWRHAIPWLKAIKKLAKQRGLDMYCISPLHPVVFPGIKMLYDAGPLDFLQMIKGADLVVTNSFHGTIFPINFQVPFLSLKVTEGSRQGQILKMCGLENRIVNSPVDFGKIRNPFEIDFTQSNEFVEEFREKSKSYLKDALLN